MKTLSAEIVLILVSAYWLLTAAAWKALAPLLPVRGLFTRHRTAGFYFSAAVTVSLSMLIMYLFHPQFSGSLRYLLYFWLNGLVMADLSVKLPLVFAFFLFPLAREGRRRLVISSMGALLSAGVALLFLWSVLSGPGKVVTREVTLSFPSLPHAFDGFRMTQISDFHLGSMPSRALLQKMIRRSESFSPDVVLFTGDLVNDRAWETRKWLPLLRQFRGKEGQLAITGNHDYGDYSHWNSPRERDLNFKGIEKAFGEGGFLLLQNETWVIARNGDTLAFIGVGNRGEFPFPRYDDLETAESGLGDAPFRILLTHDPAHWEEEVAGNPRYPLTLSGHTHGLQWGIHMAGIGFSVARAVRHHWGGLYRKDGQFLYVNRGAGVIGMPYRIDMPPEITLITLRKAPASCPPKKR